MIDIRRVEIDGLLDAAQAERVGEEFIVGGGTRGHRRDVVQAPDLGNHIKPLVPVEPPRGPLFMG
ncbi:hypothetical protein D3C77_801630 [compost metagenome]